MMPPPQSSVSPFSSTPSVPLRAIWRNPTFSGADSRQALLAWDAVHCWLDVCIESAWRHAVKLIGILLIVFGIVALAVGGISYTTREKVIDLGPIQATANRQKTIPLSPIAGIASIAAGVALVVVGGRRVL